MVASRLFAGVLMMLACSSAACSASTDVSDGTEQASDDLSRARFTVRSKPTNKALEALYVAGAKFEYGYLGVYRFNKVGPEATDLDARYNRVKEVMHRYMCRLFDEEISMGRNAGGAAKRVETVLSDINLYDYADEQEADADAFSAALTAVYADPNLDVLSGQASGNNTFGEIMGVYDIKNNEILFFGFTNCGSDN